MIAVNLNSKILNSAPATTQTGAFWNGFDRFCQGARVEEMPTREHENGWWHALHCANDTLDYESDIYDRERHARGQW